MYSEEEEVLPAKHQHHRQTAWSIGRIENLMETRPPARPRTHRDAHAIKQGRGVAWRERRTG